MILTAKRLFLNWNWAVVQQCSFLCIMPYVSAPQPAWVQLDLLQEGPGVMGPAELTPSLSPIPPSPLVLKFKLNAIFSSFEPEYTLAELQWLLNSNSKEKTDIICHQGWERVSSPHFIHGRQGFTD